MVDGNERLASRFDSTNPLYTSYNNIRVSIKVQNKTWLLSSSTDNMTRANSTERRRKKHNNNNNQLIMIATSDRCV